jgi:hypothetical protein
VSLRQGLLLSGFGVGGSLDVQDKPWTFIVLQLLSGTAGKHHDQ